MLAYTRSISADNGERALDHWDARQLRFGDGLHALAQHMEQQLIWKTPDFAVLDGAAVRSGWQSTTTLARRTY